ncbi:DUF6083 domain-containing protein [Streptomyces sp. JJ66]|uniref:DUF6083 domain-containing protein n=1 Tax=Streptomyces sp. JJ66 TaxID=2803843 RepID=UPI00214B6BDB|nr:DUF6083 domain-containing protein [Streptomyces sp. JJ66]
MRIGPGNASHTLVRNTRGRCRWCGNPVEWRDSFDQGRVPLMPQWFPARKIPPRYRWHVETGIAFLGAHPNDLGRCRVKHSTVCPAIEHEDLTDPVMLQIVSALGVAQQKFIARGFVPAPPAASEAEVQEPDPPSAARAGGQRHIIAYCRTLRIAPGRIEDLRCLATASTTAERCKNFVFDAAEGAWTKVEIPEDKSRAGQTILNITGGYMWVWALDALDYQNSARWMRQRCPDHATHATAPDARDNELVTFDPKRHGDFVLARRPTGYDYQPLSPTPEPDAPLQTRQCATDGCHNSTVIKNTPADWLCYLCTRRARRRHDTHRKWQSGQPNNKNPRQ